MLNVFTDPCARRSYKFVATSIVTTPALFDVDAKVVQPESYSFINWPNPALHFCHKNVSNELAAFIYIYIFLTNKG